MCGCFFRRWGTWAGIYCLFTNECPLENHGATTTTAVSLFAYRELNRVKSYNAFVTLGTNFRYRSVLLRFSLLWSRMCLFERPHVSYNPLTFE